jgi:hypothetical protein
MSNRWLVAAVVASLALNVAVVGSYAWSRLHRPPGPRLPGVRAEMRERMHHVFQESRPEVERLMQQNERIRDAMAQEVWCPQLDERRLDSLARESGRIHGLMTLIAYHNARRAAELLPEPERRQFIERISRQGRPGPRGRGRPGPPPEGGPPPECPLPGPPDGR